MTIKTFTVVVTLAFGWSACNNDTPQQSTAPEAAPTTTSDATTQSAPGDVALTPSVLPAAPPASAADPAAQAAAPAGGAVKINPPHGQPGHVCGTPVGAPLDGSAAKTASPQPAAKSATLPPPGGAGTASVAPGTNPPHGQPGHVCGTPVGAPLPKQ